MQEQDKMVLNMQDILEKIKFAPAEGERPITITKERDNGEYLTFLKIYGGYKPPMNRIKEVSEAARYKSEILIVDAPKMLKRYSTRISKKFN